MPTINPDILKDLAANLIQQSAKGPLNKTTLKQQAQNTTLLKAIPDLFQSTADNKLEDKLLSISLAVLSNDNTLFCEAFGFLNPGQDSTPVNTDTSYNLASISKFILTVMILRLVDQKKLSLHDSIAQYIKDNSIPGVDTITISDLLCHRSGLKDVGFITLKETDPVNKLLKPADATCQRGQFYYANINFVLIANIIKHCMGCNLQDSFTVLIGHPLNITDIYVINDAIHDKNNAVGYKANQEDNQLMPDSDNYLFGATGFRGTSKGLVRLIAQVFTNTYFIAENTRKVVLESIKDEMFEVVTKTATYRWPIKIGLGIEERTVEISPGHTVSIFGHGGWQDGSTSFVAFVPALGMAFCGCASKTQGMENLKQLGQSSLFHLNTHKSNSPVDFRL